MRFTTSICRVFLILSLVVTEAEFSQLNFGTILIDEQLHLFEMMLDTCTDWDFGPNIDKLIENREGLPTAEKAKRITLYKSCVRRYRDRMLYFVKRYNAHTKNILDRLFPEDNKVQHDAIKAGDYEQGFVQHAVDMDQFHFHEMPNYYYDLGKNMSVDFSEEEIKREAKVIGAVQEMSKQEIRNISSQLGITITPSSVHV